MKVRPFKATEVVSTPDGDFTLAIDMEIIDALEDDFNARFDEIMQRFQSEVRVGKLARLLRGLLSRNHPELSLDDVGGLVMEYAEVFSEGMGRLFTKARPDDGKEAKGENPPKRAGVRKTSSARGAVAA